MNRKPNIIDQIIVTNYDQVADSRNVVCNLELSICSAKRTCEREIRLARGNVMRVCIAMVCGKAERENSLSRNVSHHTRNLRGRLRIYFF